MLTLSIAFISSVKINSHDISLTQKDNQHNVDTLSEHPWNINALQGKVYR